MGIGFVVPGTPLAFGMVCGAVSAFLVRKFKPRIWELYGYPFAAGMSAGEACTGLLIAGLVVAGVDGSHVGTQIGCPFGSC
jgi:hypothetical protein